MIMPVQALPVARGAGQIHDAGTVAPSGCSVFKKVACGTALVACGAVCIGTIGAACVQCLAGIGASGCIDCL
jgi:hypothetical protein